MLKPPQSQNLVFVIPESFHWLSKTRQFGINHTKIDPKTHNCLIGFCMDLFSILVRFGKPTWSHLGYIFLPRAVQDAPRCLLDGPRGAKIPPRSSKTPPRQSQTLPRRLQVAPRLVPQAFMPTRPYKLRLAALNAQRFQSILGFHV